MKNPSRTYLIYGVAMLATIAIGLLSRADFLSPPKFVRLYVGDALWALLVFWIACVIRPDWRTRHRALTAIAISFAVEFSQFYQAPWINEIRRTWLGGIVLGFGFRFSDLIAYGAGVLCGALIDYRLIRERGNGKRPNAS